MRLGVEAPQLRKGKVIVYDGGALYLTYATLRYASLTIALALWMLYFHETLIRSGRIRIQWLKNGLTNLLLMLSIAVATLLFFAFVGSFYFSLHRSH